MKEDAEGLCLPAGATPRPLSEGVSHPSQTFVTRSLQLFCSKQRGSVTCWAEPVSQTQNWLFLDATTAGAAAGGPE